MTWTTTAEVRNQVQKLWDKGLILARLADGESLFPRRLTLKGPSSAELADRFEQVRTWIADLRQGHHYRVVMRELRHRVIGTNVVPDEIWIDTFDDALALIGKRREARRFSELVAGTRSRQPAVLPWLAKHPLRALELAEDWPLLVNIAGWMQAHPRPGIYLRQMDLPGIHSKFIEVHRAVLSELLDLVLPADAIDVHAVGVMQFCRRYGFRDKPPRVRFRVLDPELALLPGGTDQDVTLNHDAFAQLGVKISRVFITENEINFLAFPNLPGSMVIFGAGYGFDMLAHAAWLHDCAIRYWGDVDTHGFAILDQLRAYLPHVQSFLMDRETLMAHRPQWVVEPNPERRDLPRLMLDERALFDDLRDNRLGASVRLEQERIGFSWVTAALEKLP
ncbi:MAG: Wadjet anti-phage system protein JetD domain-containing protein [Gammaproteobacteria bacterium]